MKFYKGNEVKVHTTFSDFNWTEYSEYYSAKGEYRAIESSEIIETEDIPQLGELTGRIEKLLEDEVIPKTI